MEVDPGRIVISKTGRDRKRMFLVLSTAEDSNYVYIADGSLRKVDKPKKKKLKHLVITDILVEKFANKLKQGIALQNSEVYKEIKRLKEESKK